MPGFTLSRRHALVAVVCAVGAVLLAARVFATSPRAEQAASPFRAPVEAASQVTPTAVVVDVAGAVRRPGVYRLRPGSRVADAIAKAGGPTRNADPALVNRAAPLVDGQQVLMPVRVGPRAGPRAGPGIGAPAPAEPVRLSSATAEQLDALPGVGPVTAQKIVAYRQEHGAFRSVDELDAISGIGPKRLESLRELVVP